MIITFIASDNSSHTSHGFKMMCFGGWLQNSVCLLFLVWNDPKVWLTKVVGFSNDTFLSSVSWCCFLPGNAPEKAPGVF